MTNFFSKMKEGFRRRFKQAETRAQLQRLTNKELKDIGINRSQIEYVANGSFGNAQEILKKAL